MRSFFIIREVFADAVDHHHNEAAIIHVQPVGAADKFIGAVSRKWAVNILAQVWLVKTCHDIRFYVPQSGIITRFSRVIWDTDQSRS
jgi:adenosine/AMP kinase